MTLNFFPTDPMCNSCLIWLNISGIQYNKNIIKNNDFEYIILEPNIKSFMGLVYYTINDLKMGFHLNQGSYETFDWINYFQNIYYNVYFNTIYLKTNNNNIIPHQKIIDQGIHTQYKFLQYMDKYLDGRIFILHYMSICDIMFFSILCSLDYGFQINWYNYPNIKKYYSAFKSMDHFYITITEQLDYLKPTAHFSQLDF